MEKKTYYAQNKGWILGEERRKGEVIEATPEEAKYALMDGSLGTEKPLTAKEQRDATAQANGEPIDPSADPEPEAEAAPAAEPDQTPKKTSGK